MSNTGHVLAATAPIYLLIVAGYLVVHFKVFTPEHMRVLGRFVTLIALPALLLRALASRPLGDILNPRYLLAYGLGSLAVLAGVWWWARRRRESSAKSALLALGMCNSNSAFIGYPVASQLVGGATAGVGLALCMLVENLLIIPLALAAADADDAAGGNVWQRLRAIVARLVRNPLIIAICVGITVSALNIPVPDVLQRTVGVVAGSASPLALFVIGGALVGLRPGGMLRDVAAVALGKLLLHPAAVLAALALFPLADTSLRRAAVIYACVPMLSIYPVLAQRYRLDSFAAAALLVATTLSFVTINLWLIWL
jgi:malonate transporter